MLQDHVFTPEHFILLCEPCGLKRSGREKKPLSLAEPAEIAETTEKNLFAGCRSFIPTNFILLCVLSVL
jgi:hypothetical protein